MTDNVTFESTDREGPLERLAGVLQLALGSGWTSTSRYICKNSRSALPLRMGSLCESFALMPGGGEGVTNVVT